MTLPRPLRIVILGGTGRLGLLLARHFYEHGHAVSTISRFPMPRPWEAIHWDAENLGDWASYLDGADILIKLAGPTSLISAAISQCAQPPYLWLNAAGADFDVPTPQTRKLTLHLAPVITPESGMVMTLLSLLRWGLVGAVFSGKQSMDWIHELDFIRAVEFLIEHEDIRGDVDMKSPCPIPTRPWRKGSPTSPNRLLAAGFCFQHPEFQVA